MVSLSTIKPNYEQINEQLQAYVSNKASWLSLQKSSTGTLLLDAISMVGEYDQYSIQAALRETNLDTPHLPESIYVNCRFLGVRLQRKTPAHCSATLQNNDLGTSFLEIPAFTQFEIEGTKYFNREAIIFNTEINQQKVELYQGEIKTAVFYGTGVNYQTFKLEEKDPWSISDQDIKCFVGVVEFKRSTDPIFMFKMGEAKFYENSYQDGNVECRFGNSIYGLSPNAGDEILFQYAVTNGSQGNNSKSDLKVTCGDYPSLTGETTSNSYGGAEEPSYQYYQYLGPASGASNGRAIIRDDFEAIVAKYPGVKDCKVYGQAEIAPNDKNWMNVVGLMLLTDSTFDENSWKDLVTYLKSLAIIGFQYKWFKAEPVNVVIKVVLHMLPNSDLTISQQKVVSAIEEYTKPQLGSLGRSLYASDIEDVIFSVLPSSIDYIERKLPQVDYIINKNQYINVTTIDISAVYSDRDSQAWINPLDPYNTQM